MREELHDTLQGTFHENIMNTLKPSRVIYIKQQEELNTIFENFSSRFIHDIMHCAKLSDNSAPYGWITGVL